MIKITDKKGYTYNVLARSIYFGDSLRNESSLEGYNVNNTGVICRLGKVSTGGQITNI